MMRSSKPVNLQGFARYFDVEECIAFVAMALERAGLTQSDLPPYQRQLLDDLYRPLDEEALAEMLPFWQLDQKKLVERGRPHNKNMPAKPEIDLRIAFTSKGNLKAEWFPRDGEGGWVPESDFPRFQRYGHRSGDITSRPSNELMFMRGAEGVLDSLRADYGRGPTADLSHVLMLGCKQFVTRLKARLDYHFDVLMLTDVFVDWEEPAQSGLGWRETPDRIARWEIRDPAERHRADQLRELEEMESALGFSETSLAEAMRLVTANGLVANNLPTPQSLPERVAKQLKKMGLPATPKKVKRALYLVNAFRTPEESCDKVVPFRNLET